MSLARTSVLWLSAVLLPALALPLHADVPATAPQVTFRFERPGLPVPSYRITVAQDGSAVYEGHATSDLTNGEPRAQNSPPPPLQGFHSAVTLSPDTTRRIFALAETLKQFHVNCSSRAKNLADTGAKTLQYSGPEGAGECTYNFSDNKNVTQLTELFQALAETMDEGRHLDDLHRYDRLGLDEAISNLAQEVTAGRAADLNTIAATLRSIAGDTDVLQRVRLKASQLLSLLPPGMQAASR